MKFINKYKSPNFNKRKKDNNIKLIIIHYTALKSNEEALKHLCSRKNKVSSHFLVSKSGQIFKLVDLNHRAWHAGVSYWLGEKDINSNSIGIELDNSGHHLNFENFCSKQVNSLNLLLIFLKKKFNIKDKNILAHSDISPYRKIDPGEKFPWHILSDLKISKIPKKLDHNFILEIEKILINKSLSKKRDKALYILSKIGYETSPALSEKTEFLKLIRAYQMHFNNSFVSGILDKRTYNLLISHYKELLTK